MSTPDETSQPLTRRQLRELKLTGQTAVISAEEIEAARVAREAEEVRVAEEARQADAARKAEQARSAEEARRAEESRKAEEAAALLAAAEESSAPAGDDEGGPRLTRREIREQERLRTNQLAVITQEDQDAAAEAASEPNVAAIETKVVGENETSVVYEVVEVPFDQRPAAQPQAPVERLHFDEDEDEGEDAAVDAQTPPAPARRADDEFAEGAVETVFVPEDAPAEAVAPQARPTLAPDFGQKVQAAPVVPPAASFEDILSQAAADSSGSGTASSALILATDPGSIPLSAPIDATGEILITRTHQLPDGYGATGHAAGTTDGKDVDVVLIDGEIPLASSPTPIAASDAVSTSKSPAEVIRPPAPEKSHRLTLILGITAGVLGIALIGVVVAAFTTGVLGS